MAQRSDWLLLTTGLARVEGEHVTYTRASSNLLGRSRTVAVVGPADHSVPAPEGSSLHGQ
jgi:hypothetical protein